MNEEESEKNIPTVKHGGHSDAVGPLASVKHSQESLKEKGFPMDSLDPETSQSISQSLAVNLTQRFQKMTWRIPE